MHVDEVYVALQQMRNVFNHSLLSLLPRTTFLLAADQEGGETSIEGISIAQFPYQNGTAHYCFVPESEGLGSGVQWVVSMKSGADARFTCEPLSEETMRTYAGDDPTLLYVKVLTGALRICEDLLTKR
jgi:hypothetical protein